MQTTDTPRRAEEARRIMLPIFTASRHIMRLLNMIVTAAIVIPAICFCFVALAAGNYSFNGVAHSFVSSVNEYAYGATPASTFYVWECTDPAVLSEQKAFEKNPHTPQKDVACKQWGYVAVATDRIAASIGTALKSAYALFVMLGGICMLAWYVFGGGRRPGVMVAHAIPSNESLAAGHSNVTTARD